MAFIKNFCPEHFCADGDYEIVLSDDGRYTVQCPNPQSNVCLSESEQRLFRYLCFLRTVEFWRGFEAIRDLHSIQKPLLVSNFLERLDESVDVENLIKKTEALNRQIIILT